MTKEEEILKGYICVYDQKVQDIYSALRSFISEKHPEANQLVYDGYNALSIAFSLSDQLKDAFCHIAAYKNHVNFGFNRGAEINNPELILEGSGKLIRHYKINDLENIPKKELSVLLGKAVQISLSSNTNLEKDMPEGKIFIMPTSGKKQRP